MNGNGNGNRADNRRNLKTDLIVLAALSALAAAVLAYATPPGPNGDATNVRILDVRHLYLQVTVWSDGSIDVPPPVDLDARTARRLANRLEDEEDRRRALRRATMPLPDDPTNHTRTSATDQAAAGDAADPYPHRCAAIASSTGRRCKLSRQPGSLYCHIHNAQVSP